jgi:hypothetical protein
MSYNGKDLTFTLNNTIETSFVTGLIYRFYITAVNIIAESKPSNVVRIALAALPL